MKTKNNKRGIKEYPYEIEGCPDLPAYPTHTHGLTEIGFPEFLINPTAFGPVGNARVINRAYDFFIKPENEENLKEILNGKTIKLTGKELRPESDGSDPNIYCFREVPPTFEAVNQAYLIEELGTDVSGMRFIQIYVEGDDFALLDEYYKGGVKW
jgi:hypothetical protein